MVRFVRVPDLQRRARRNAFVGMKDLRRRRADGVQAQIAVDVAVDVAADLADPPARQA